MKLKRESLALRQLGRCRELYFSGPPLSKRLDDGRARGTAIAASECDGTGLFKGY